VFVIQAAMGMVAWGGVYRMAEPLKTFERVSPAGTIFFQHPAGLKPAAPYSDKCTQGAEISEKSAIISAVGST